MNAEPHRATAAGGSWWPSGRARILLRSTGSGHAGCRVGRFHGTLSLFLQSAVQRKAGAGASPQGSYHPGSGYFQGRESAQVTRIGADYLACRSILAIVPPCAGECRLVRVTGVLIFVNSRTCVALVLLPSRPAQPSLRRPSPDWWTCPGSLANCRYCSSARPLSSRFRCHAGNNVP